MKNQICLGKNKGKLSLIIVSFLLLSLFFTVTVYQMPLVHAQSVARVQGCYEGNGTSSPITVTLGSAPISGDVIIATIAMRVASGMVTSITESGVNWTQGNPQVNSNSVNYDSEIWLGVAGASASTSISIAANGTIYDIIAVVCEYSGIKTLGFLDQKATSIGTSANPVTGTTPTTTNADDLLIGTICLASVAQQTPTNGFSLLDGAYNAYVSNAYLEMNVTATGAYSSGTNAVGGSGHNYFSCIAAFEEAAPTTASIVFNSSPTGSGFILVNGTAQTTPYTVSAAAIGDTYNISANSPANTVSNQTQYIYSSWNDSGAQTHTITVSVNATYTASFTEQYAINPSSDSNSVITPSTVTWANSGANQTFNYTANSGFNIASVLVDNVPLNLTTYSSNYTFTTIANYHNITVTSSLISQLTLPNPTPAPTPPFYPNLPTTPTPNPTQKEIIIIPTTFSPALLIIILIAITVFVLVFVALTPKKKREKELSKLFAERRKRGD